MAHKWAATGRNGKSPMMTRSFDPGIILNGVPGKVGDTIALLLFHSAITITEDTACFVLANSSVIFFELAAQSDEIVCPALTSTIFNILRPCTSTSLSRPALSRKKNTPLASPRLNRCLGQPGVVKMQLGHFDHPLGNVAMKSPVANTLSVVTGMQ